MNRTRIPIWVTVLTLLVFASGVAGMAHHALLAARAPDSAAAMDALAPGLMYLMTGVGFAVLMIVCIPPVAGDTSAQLSKAVATLTDAIDELKLANDRRAEMDDARRYASDAVAPVAPPAPVTPPEPVADHWPRVIDLLDELRELAMMSDSQRKARFLQHASRRKTLLLRQAVHHIGAGKFADAERLVEQCAAAYATDDADVSRVRQQLADARDAAATTAVDNVRSQVEDLMALSRWDEAMDVVERLSENYPTSAHAQHLRDRTAHERDVFRNAACQRLYDEIRAEIDHRDWRKALAGTQSLLEKFGDLPRADKVRATLRTIQDNAEIQERQELEARIQELIRGHRFSDAIELSEELIARFPGSPQADKLRDLLPKLHEHAIKHEARELMEKS